MAAVIAKGKDKQVKIEQVVAVTADSNTNADANSLASDTSGPQNPGPSPEISTHINGSDISQPTSLLPPTDATSMLDNFATESVGETTEDIDGKRYRRRRCEVPGCTKFARFNNACSGHGGRRLCSQKGCKRVAQFGHKCSAHGGIKFCSVEGCNRAVQSRGCCKTHGGGVRCQFPGCTKGAISKGHCRTHGGGSRCAEPGCVKWAQRHGYCVRHSKALTATESKEAVI
ncbi:TPA: hypothetical protein N0F65_011629 [Lagenidium giganteum]|uniref:WRKY19-like zinc finger domain-containing protein n=1 Tax=Lagenidium giganteum TaxID=4803 RepID=A0AAV2ZBG4_9STRA|nr:TPA: hypothetical protein N0F65_011629 [Lagenidium giganteum]